jgi:hypothetical protein
MCEGPLPQRLWERRGCACRLTGRAWAQPEAASWNNPSPLRQGTRNRPEAWCPAPARLLGPRRWLLARRRGAAQVAGGGPSPAPVAHGRTPRVQPRLCRGRQEGTAMCRGPRAPYESALCLPSPWQEPLKTCVGQSRGRPPQMAMQPAPVARDGRRSACPPAEKLWHNPLQGGVCLLTKGVLIRVRRGPRLPWLAPCPRAMVTPQSCLCQGLSHTA